ncbi:uncharacterized protein Triagg1_9204 [Trichoderma aggressivum f. europaeum]|uniref:Uncharacterized protein n=1 Tax=Trichoderma aggressivum f. europaeum TaxID=173218 RepID=A0AAE1I8T1_9HYPO|nr:hypothetical protein Triagg1_9204 [Trichoderma aggressivum f. europaeum]
MSSRPSVYVHQTSSGPSTASSSSRSSSSSAHYAASNSRSVSDAREYDAERRSAQVVRTAGSVVVNHHRRDYETDSPSPRYRGGYQ